MSDKPSLPETPIEVMRARHPDLFSDSEIKYEPKLNKKIFEYHLETLTNRNEEKIFEYFCRRIAQKEICPNLRPQTGPTGGGDSKVDTETYPVADTISLTWFEGIGREAANERWAFAFSAKKQWRPKVKSDVKSIISTKRNYKLIYFITNQFVRDKTRAELEDELSKEYQVDIRILDRTWIIEAVFDRNNIHIAIESLNLTEFQNEEYIKTGPNDAQRITELEELDASITDAQQYDGIKFQLAEDCLRSAILARGLERQKNEVEARLNSSLKIAEEVGDQNQLLRVLYSTAWTFFWWYPDIYKLNKIYTRIEDLTKDSDQAGDLSLLSNLWQLLYGCVRKKELTSEEAKIEQRTKGLLSKLKNISQDSKRPNNALEAQTLILFIEITIALDTEDTNEINRVLSSFKQIFADAENLGSYPFEQYLYVLKEFGHILVSNEIYDEVFEYASDIMGERRSEGESGLLLLERGHQKLKGGKKYDAIRFFGLAQEKLIKEEYQSELIIALVSCAIAYEQSGLLWAARSNVIGAVSITLSQFNTSGEVIRPTILALQKLIWIELQLGRVLSVMSWMEVTNTCVTHCRMTQEQKMEYAKVHEKQDIVLGLLLLKSPLQDLKKIEFLPDHFDALNLPMSSIALLYALGYEDTLRQEGTIPEVDTECDVTEFFAGWLNQPVNDDLPTIPIFMENGQVSLSTKILGCSILATAESIDLLDELEMFLSSFEAFFATSSLVDATPFCESVSIKVSTIEDDVALFDYNIDKQGGLLSLKINYSKNLKSLNRNEQSELSKKVIELIIDLTPQFLLIREPELYLDDLFKNQRVPARATIFTNTSIGVKNTLGRNPRFTIEQWKSSSDGRLYPLNRKSPYYEGLNLEHTGKSQENSHKKRVSEDGSKINYEDLKHSSTGIYSIIDVPLWDKADWNGTVFMTIPDDPSAPPIMGLLYKDKKSAEEIFNGLRTRVGYVDEKSLIRVSVIKGVQKLHPFHYGVSVGPNIENIQNRTEGFFISVSRNNRMTPENPNNLNHFLDEYNKKQRFLLAPAYMDNVTKERYVDYELGIGKFKLHARDAWEIGENDIDCSALSPSDDPIIPQGIEHAPVEVALKKLRSKFK